VSSDPVELLIDFLNTVDVEVGTDLLGDDVQWSEWARARGLAPGDRALARAARDGLRQAATHAVAPPEAPGTAGQVVSDPTAVPAGTAVPAAVPALPLHVSWATAGPELTGAPGVGGPDAAGTALAAAVVLNVQGRLVRVKICPADGCAWAFYDRSRNSSRVWCSMAECGNRAKTRAFRERHAD
jgi:predicted RNA-binding Zn ribbon-like protein